MLFPGFDGGGEWGGPAVDPDGILYVNGNEMAWLVSLCPAPKEAELSQMSPGRRLYTEYCVPCHGPERKGLPAGGIPSLVGVASRLSRDRYFQPDRHGTAHDARLSVPFAGGEGR